MRFLLVIFTIGSLEASNLDVETPVDASTPPGIRNGNSYIRRDLGIHARDTWKAVNEEEGCEYVFPLPGDMEFDDTLLQRSIYRGFKVPCATNQPFEMPESRWKPTPELDVFSGQARVAYVNNHEVRVSCYDEGPRFWKKPKVGEYYVHSDKPWLFLNMVKEADGIITKDLHHSDTDVLERTQISRKVAREGRKLAEDPTEQSDLVSYSNEPAMEVCRRMKLAKSYFEYVVHRVIDSNKSK